MSEIGEMFKDLREDSKQRRSSNLENSTRILSERGVKFVMLSLDHYRVGDYDFWPSTGLFIHIKTKKRGRGVFNLIERMKK